MVLAVIPARYASARLPGKALADLGGTPMVVRVWNRVRRAEGIDRVLVATDDARIAEIVRAHGGEAVMTGPCVSGTDRVAEAARNRGARVVVNVQGDEPFVDPTDITRVGAAVSDGTPIATAAAPLTEGVEDPARVKVVCDEAGRALYFSRHPIPHGGPWRLHVGIYAFTAAALEAVAGLPPSPLERAERLEQLRWLEAGYRIRVVPVPEGPLSVDTPEDLIRARARLERRS
ncbi:MAG: 3-deoxy-manno-octulosonate cytidylyltransferase [Pseudomonadota bacterium]|nr:3-deoxy-manno-octulosonate cytidylyltransferase [Pseudomonadota bacterium]